MKVNLRNRALIAKKVEFLSSALMVIWSMYKVLFAKEAFFVIVTLLNIIAMYQTYKKYNMYHNLQSVETHLEYNNLQVFNKIPLKTRLFEVFFAFAICYIFISDMNTLIGLSLGIVTAIFYIIDKILQMINGKLNEMVKFTAI